ncbi:unnamed protein product [Lactuca saligna]|uniref:Uncharacterized protein n=1 Tax=Lactuca saligna TaxID=75948 RepID=A0AA35Y5P9_LACSI|nr:unnamed protein product [Lactuca saligna]
MDKNPWSPTRTMFRRKLLDDCGICCEPVVEVNGRIIKLQIVEVDLDWAPFKQRYYSTDVSSSSEDGDDEDDEEDVDRYMSDTIPSENISEDLEEGEIGHTNTEFVKDSYIDNTQLNVGGNVQSPEVNSSPVEDAAGENDRVSGNAFPGEHQKSVKDINVHGEQLDHQTQCRLKMNVGQDERLIGPLNNLSRSNGLGLFTNNSKSGENQRYHTGVNFEGSQDKRRRISNIVVDGFNEDSHPSTPQSSIDLNKTLIPSQIPLPDSDADSPSASSDIRNTIEVGRLLGFDVDVDNSVLMEVLGDEGENQIPQ